MRKNNSRTDACPSSDELYAFCVGKLATETLTEIAEHLNTCEHCTAKLDGLDDRSDPTIVELQRPLEQDDLTEVESRRAIELVESIGSRTEQPATETGEPTAELPVPISPRPEGARQLGQYVLMEPLGEGGMGQVFKARHRLMDRIVAIKVIHGKYFNRASIVQRFLREIRALGRLDHPNIVRAQYADQVGDTHFLVMEYVAGTDLGRLVSQRGPLPVAEACTYILQAATGLQHAHEHGLVHRDIKPSNLLVADSSGDAGVVKVLDLGLAAFHEEQPAAGELTESGQVMGTADYMAPEQWENTHAVDIRADIYSLGCTLYHLLAGNPPFCGPGYSSMIQKMKAHVSEPIPPIQQHRPDIPDGLAAVLDQLLAKDPAERYATPAEAAEALRPFALGEQPAAKAPPGARLAVRLLRGKPATKVFGQHRGKRTVGCSLQVAITLSALMVVVAGGWMLMVHLGAFAEKTFPAAPQEPGPKAAPPPGKEHLHVEQMVISHYRYNQQTKELADLGSIGVSSTSARLDDEVRVRVRLNEPAFCYLIAFNPDGREQLCWAKDAAGKGVPPPQLVTFNYPLAPNKYFALSDGVGLQVFVLLASREPLPPYEQWNAKVGAAPWRAAIPADGLWRFDGHDFVGGPRGVEVERPLKQLPKALEDLCHFLKDRPGVDAIEAVAFPVKPKE
jgi:tRNA A-37 threonylcarbamoyl transferase component Bud32